MTYLFEPLQCSDLDEFLKSNIFILLLKSSEISSVSYIKLSVSANDSLKLLQYWFFTLQLPKGLQVYPKVIPFYLQCHTCILGTILPYGLSCLYLFVEIMYQICGNVGGKMVGKWHTYLQSVWSCFSFLKLLFPSKKQIL